MYYLMVLQCTQGLKNIEAWLDRAEHHASAKQFDVGVLMTSRLAPDMRDFVYQVPGACDYVKGAAAWLSGQMAISWLARFRRPSPPGSSTALNVRQRDRGMVGSPADSNPQSSRNCANSCRMAGIRGRRWWQ